MRKMSILLGVILAAGCGGTSRSGDASLPGSSSPTPTTSPTPSVTVPSTLALAFQADNLAVHDGAGVFREPGGDGKSCGINGFTEPSDKFAYMVPQAEVLVRSGSGEIIGKGTLDGAGVVSKSTSSTGTAGTFTCTWAATASDVQGADFYTFEIHGEAVGHLSRSELASSPSPITIDMPRY
jgi:hypothetical protein